jgi:hypothetical protein
MDVYQCGFRRNRSTVDHILQIFEKKWEYNDNICQLFIDLKRPMTPYKENPYTIS